MEYKIHHYNSISVAEVTKCSSQLCDNVQILDLMANTQYNNAAGIILRKEFLHPSFFDLKTGLAGEILQKFSNYRMRLAIVGDFSGFKSKSLQDFIRESNRTGRIIFVQSLEEAINRLCGVKSEAGL